jgi:hypothetical protein
MAQGPENRMLNRLKPKLEKRLGIYIEKTNNVFRRGMPDWYVEWDGGCGWIEAKFWNRNAPVAMDDETCQRIHDMCSTLQKRWLTRAYNNGVKVAILCGFADKKFFFDGFGIITQEHLSEEELFTSIAIWIRMQ